jgi:branched-chain amino acid transport system permease protein
VLPQLVVSGLAQGVVYALVALSMTMVYRATTVVNFGHGDLVMGGAFVVYVLVVYARLPYVVGGLLALGLLFGLGVAIHQGIMRRIMTGPHLAIAMMALAVGYALRGGRGCSGAGRCCRSRGSSPTAPGRSGTSW